MQQSNKLPFADYTPDSPDYWNQGAQEAQNCLPYLASPNYAQSPSVSLSAIGNINGSSYVANAVDNGGTSMIYRTSALTAIAGTKAGAISFWMQIDGLPNTTQTIIYISTTGGPGFGGLVISINSSGVLSFVAKNSANTTIMSFVSSTIFSPSATWYNILAYWDLAAGTKGCYVNNVSALGTVTTFTNDTIDYAGSRVGVFGNASSSPLIANPFDGSLAEMWFNTASIDFSSAPNRAKFILSGLPVNLGSTGQTPIGSSPIIYLKGAAGANNINSGTGGDFTLNGTFSIASSSPSDSTPTQYLGAISVIDSSGLPHTYAGTTNKIAEITATTANDVSKSGGYGCTTFWKFAGFTAAGTDNVYATDYADAVQVMAVGATAFADLGGSPPKAKCIAQIGQFIVLGNTTGGTYNGLTAGAVPNRVWWPAIANPASWPDPLGASAPAAQAGAQDLNLNYGSIQHISNGQLYGLIFQENAITNMYYQGGDAVFNFNTFEKQRGLYCPNGACQVGGLVYFPHSSGFFVTDGASVEPIGHDLVDNTWLADLNTAYLDHVRASHDVTNKCIWWTYPSVSSTLSGTFVTCDKVIVYNYANKRWGMGYVGQSIDIIFNAFTLGYTMEQLDSVNSNLDLITPSLDSPYWNGGQPTVGVFGIQQIGATGAFASYYGSFSGAALTATLVTKTININQGGRAFVNSFKPVVLGGSPTITGYPGTQTLLTDSITYGAGVTPETRTGKCSVRSDGVFHTFKLDIAGGFTNAMGVEFEAKASGWA